ncbi:MAG: hypothetical protein ABI137_00050 [Antricoccus sp.]
MELDDTPNQSGVTSIVLRMDANGVGVYPLDLDYEFIDDDGQSHN